VQRTEGRADLRFMRTIAADAHSACNAPAQPPSKDAHAASKALELSARLYDSSCWARRASTRSGKATRLYERVTFPCARFALIGLEQNTRLQNDLCLGLTLRDRLTQPTALFMLSLTTNFFPS
jgi:hypothetical protein